MISLSHYSYTYPGVSTPALHDLSFSVKKGEVVIVTGPTGAGKTTLTLAASGILHHDYGGKATGEVAILGKDVSAFSGVEELGQHIGIVFDDADAQLIFTTVEEEIASGLENLDLPREELIRRMEHVLAITGTEELRDRAPYTLSGGQKQRVAIAATLALGTDILILDEPTSELDEEGSQMLFHILSDLKNEGKTVLLVEHKLDALITLADRMIFLDEGAIVAEGSPEDLLKDEKIRKVLHRDHLIVDESTCCRQTEYRVDTMTDPPVIEIRGLVHRYDQFEALKGIDLSISAGSFVALIGDNGSGKTSLIKHLNGLLRPTEGTIMIKGVDTASQQITELARIVGLVFQNPDTMLFEESVEREIAFGLKNLGVDDIDQRVSAVLDQVGLSGMQTVYPRSLSRGERQRLAVACIIAMQPAVIVLDEPTTGLDARESTRVMEIALALQQQGHTIVMVTHNMQIVQDYADRIVLLEKGMIIADTQYGGGGVICSRLCNTSA
ncbi:ABC transporter ATP-binding protein [Methanosphaerula palustris]|uniref:ABC transporter related n=1 Tax=Methanosphaerula palustris (strain ATCC BAA-1556 / DSM 19958 / E1-9c) TaxID=521011 RepID=B8GJG1_METPE|nr:ABC transporter ATP-binding protein [Methanosphaerula palustris]ACL17002.1 ABC transporter related [Methanosphaerula palustris E1-9c]